MMRFLPPLRTLDQRHRFIALLLGVGLGAVLLAALGFEYIGKQIPCKLCLEQRVPYYIGVPIMLLATLLVGRVPSVFIRFFFALTCILMLYNFGLAVYHAGAEWKFWPGPLDCATATAIVIEDVGNLLDNLNVARPVSCTEASFYFLGLSMAGWNGVASFIAALVAAMGMFLRRPKLA